MTEPPERLESLLEENQALREALAALRLSNARLVAAISHESRIPLTAIKGYTDLLRAGAAGEINEQQRTFLDVISNNAGRLGDLIAGLVDLTRLEAGQLEIDPVAVPVAPLIQQAIDAAGAFTKEKDLVISLALGTDLPDVRADAARLRQVLQILLDNAWRYSKKGGEIAVRTSTDADRSRLYIEITDSGIGIERDDIAKLFEPFFRSEDPQVRAQQGWGLGLSLAKGLVEAMDGSIDVKSEPEAGATFRIALPLA